jgi:hypothetical protein
MTQIFNNREGSVEFRAAALHVSSWGVIDMTARSRKANLKHLLYATGRHHLKTLELERRQSADIEKAWNFSEFVTRLLEIIVVLRTGDKSKNVPPEE